MGKKFRSFIKRCPCCNGTALLSPYSKAIVNKEPRRMTYVQCDTCGLRGPRVLYPNDPSVEKKKFQAQAIESWNRRDFDKTLIFEVSKKVKQYVAETFDTEPEKSLALSLSNAFIKLLNDTAEDIPVFQEPIPKEVREARKRGEEA